MKKKKVIALILTLVLCVSLGACGGSSYETATLDTPITNEFTELNIYKTKLTRAASNEKTNLDLSAKDDNVWFLAMGTVKNLGSESVDFVNGFKGKLTVDDKYEYDLTLSPEISSKVEPLQMIEFALYVGLPQEVIDTLETYNLTFGFNEAYASVDDLEKAKYKYSITGSMEEFGSAENIENFVTFSEYIETTLQDAKYENLEAELDQSREVVDVKDGNALAFIEYKDNFEFTAIPWLRLNYGSFDIYKQSGDLFDTFNYGELYIEFKNSSGNKSDLRFIDADTITISSDNGKMEIGEGDFEKDYDFNTIINQVTITYKIDPNKRSFNELYEIVSGDNLSYSFDLKFSGDNATKEFVYKCDDKTKETLLKLLDFYKELPFVAVS